jgi:phosphoglycerate kinase
VSGFLMEDELKALGRVLEDPARPLAVLIGGAKISTKMGVLEHLLGIADEFLIGGGMANTFLLAQGCDVGTSLVERDQVETARAFLDSAKQAGRDVYLPVDVVIADNVAAGAETRTVPLSDIPEGWSIVDIGPQTVSRYEAVVWKAGTVVWNGPMGVFEISEFGEGTRALARALAEGEAWTVVGGGDSVAAIEQLGIADRFGHVSTGGGASLEFLEGRGLPGVEALNDRSAA